MKFGWAWALGLGVLVGCGNDSLCGNSDYAALCPNNYPPPDYDAAFRDAGTVVDAAAVAPMDASLLDAAWQSADASSDAAR